jgi:aminoglycoside phosphotransferase (APT) family kinase protein
VTSCRASQFNPKADSALDDSDFRSLAGGGVTLKKKDVFAALSRLSYSVGNLESVAAGTFSEIWRFNSSDRPLLLKASRDVAAGGLAVEALVSSMLASQRIDHPQVHGFDDSLSLLPVPFVVMDFVEGRSMRELDNDADMVARKLPKIAEMFRRIHTVSGAGYGLIDVVGGALEGTHETWGGYLATRFDAHLQFLIVSGLLKETEADELRVAAAPIEPRPPPKLLHGDCGPHNIMIGNMGSPVFIDWEDATFGDPEFDLALWATFNPSWRWPIFFNAYNATTVQSIQFWRYFARITVAKIVVRTRLGYPDAAGRPSRVDRLQQALEGVRYAD